MAKKKKVESEEELEEDFEDLDDEEFESAYPETEKKTAKESKDPQRVPYEWPLPKEERPGENSFDDDELSPDEFSRLLVGGRSGGI